MNRTRSALPVLILTAVVLTGIQAPACARSGGTPSAGDEKSDPDAAQIRALIDKYRQSIDRADTALGAQIWSTTADVTFIHPRGHERGWEQVRTNFYEKTMGALLSERTLTVHDMCVHVYGDTAWSEFYWDFVAKLKANGQTLTTHGRETQVYRKSGDGWRIVHVHYSGMPMTGQGQGF